MRLGRYEWDWTYWSLSRQMKQPLNYWTIVFQLRCVLCMRLSLGCNSHWFCDLCKTCELIEPTLES
jgi:hypothetical protein